MKCVLRTRHPGHGAEHAFSGIEASFLGVPREVHAAAGPGTQALCAAPPGKELVSRKAGSWRAWHDESASPGSASVGIPRLASRSGVIGSTRSSRVPAPASAPHTCSPLARREVRYRTAIRVARGIPSRSMRAISRVSHDRLFSPPSPS